MRTQLGGAEWVLKNGPITRVGDIVQRLLKHRFLTRVLNLGQTRLNHLLAFAAHIYQYCRNRHAYDDVLVAKHVAEHRNVALADAASQRVQREHINSPRHMREAGIEVDNVAEFAISRRLYAERHDR